MPYYCTVPRCTSMAGKAKDVSFHQFPKDKRLADIWNEILKRGKPYTKYSKVCSLHFTHADYTSATVGKHKGHWRTLRKNAIPSRNLPSEPPAPAHKGRSSSSNPPLSSNPTLSASTSAPVLEIEVGQHIAHAIYVQTMLALQKAGDGDRATSPSVNGDTLSDSEMSAPRRFHDLEGPRGSQSKMLEELLSKKQKRIQEFERIHNANSDKIPSPAEDSRASSNSYRCDECSKCFKDPDVYLLHKRTHKNNVEPNERLQENEKEKEKENFNVNKEKSEETLKANPILANLLKTNMNNIQGGAAIKNVAILMNGDKNVNGSESDNSGVNSECNDNVEDSSENVIVKSEICIEEHDVMDEYLAVKAAEYTENDENTNKSLEDIKNAYENPIEQLFIVKTELLGEAARLNSEYSKMISKSDIKVEENVIEVKDDLITVEDLIDS